MNAYEYNIFISKGWNTIGCLWVKNFTLPVGDMNSPSDNKFTEGIDFFRQAAQTLGRALKF